MSLHRVRARSVTSAVALAAASALALTGCSAKAEQSSLDSASGGLKTGPGVTDSTIKLGMLTDLTGPFAALDKQEDAGIELYWDDKNAHGGICDGRKVELVYRDHHYDPQAAVSLYSELSGQVLALQATIGSPTTMAILPQLKQDKMLAVAGSWSPTLLQSPSIILAGTTYDIEMVNAVDYLVDEGKLAKGDKIGYIYFEGDYGEPGLAGATYAAKQHGITVVGQQVAPTAADVSAQVHTLARAGVKALFLSTSGRQVASAAAVSDAAGLTGPIVAAAPGFTPELLDTRAGDALLDRLYVISSVAAFSGKGPGAQKARALFEAKKPDVPASSWIDLGYASAAILDQAISAACENGDVTREGLQQAFRANGEHDTGGTTVPLDFSDPHASPSTTSFVLRPDKDAVGGLVEVKQPFTGADVDGYLAQR